MDNEEKIKELERENLALLDIIQDLFNVFHMKKDLINKILRGRAQGIILAPEETKE